MTDADKYSKKQTLFKHTLAGQATHSTDYGTIALFTTKPRNEIWLFSNKMRLPVLQLLQPPRPQSLVNGFIFRGAGFVGAAGGRRLRG